MSDRIKAVIFDLDGTLIDTEKYYRIAWPKAFEHFGYRMTDEEVLSLRSLGRPFAPEYLKKISKDPDFDYEKVRSYRKIVFNEILEKEGLNLKKGAADLLTFLREKGVVTAVATATEETRAREYLTQIGLIDGISVVISATMVKEGKPSPDIYELAFDRLKSGVFSNDCDFGKENVLAVEDSPNGARSAYEAKLKLVYIPDQTPADEEIRKMSYYVGQSLFDLIENSEDFIF